MPELPEVETLRRGLAARTVGMSIAALEILDGKIIDAPGDVVRQDVTGRKISRVGKACPARLRHADRPDHGRWPGDKLLPALPAALSLNAVAPGLARILQAPSANIGPSPIPIP